MKKHTLNLTNLSHPSIIEKILDAMNLAFTHNLNCRTTIGSDVKCISSVKNKEKRPIIFTMYSEKKGFRHYTASKREVGQKGGIEITDLINQVLFEAQRKLS